MSMRKASVLDMATAAYELDAAVKRGVLVRVEGRLTIMGEDLDNVLKRFEGQEIVICPFCEMRSVVRGEAGVRRYQVPQRVDREQAEKAFRGFLGNWAIARSVPREAKLNEVFVAHLPFWATWGRAVGWVFGKEQVGSGDHKRWEPREKKVVQEMAWNSAACTQPYAGEFVVTELNGAEVARVLTNYQGQVMVNLSPGRYLVGVRTESIYPYSAPLIVNVLPGRYTSITFRLDSGQPWQSPSW